MKNTRGKQKILLVDGDGERRRQMTEVLQSVFHVIPAFDGEMAVEVLHSRQDFAAIVLQCRLFDFSGFDVMGFLHTNRSLVGIPVIAMGGAEDELKALSLGAVAFVQQPKEPYLISYQIQNLVGLVWSDRDGDMLSGVLQWEPF